MDLWWFLAVCGIGIWAFRRGKQLGSQFAYRIGRRHGRRSTRHRR